MMPVGRTLITLGIFLVALGGLVMLAGRLGMPRLPGDITIQRGSFTLYFPIVTSLLLSVLLTVILNLLLARR
ncbi:MAG: DUF2905 domain-containing protein [Armatimonadetes bacterium]|nr:DUF2905 domain-containing protein [Armatimonadota bacterium]